MALSKEEVGKNVKRAREIRSKAIGYKYTQTMLAKDAKVSQGYISDIESGRSYPSTPVANSIAELCGVSLDFIVGKEEPGTKEKTPEALKKIKDSVSEILDVVYLPVVGHIPAGKPLLVEETIETYLPYSKEYDPERHFVLRVHGDSMKDAGILNGDLVVIRQQPTAENGQIIAIRLKDDGVTLKKFHQEADKILLKPCNKDYKPIELNENAEIIGIAVSITKKLI